MSHTTYLSDKHREPQRISPENLDAFHTAVLAITNQLDMAALLSAIVKQACNLADTNNGVIFLLDSSEKHLTPRVARGLHSHLQMIMIKPGEGLAGMVWQKKQTIIVDNYNSWPQRMQVDTFDQVKAAIGIPMFTDSQVSGVLLLAHTTDKPFTAEKIELLERFARFAALAISNAGLHSALQHKLAEHQASEARISHLAYHDSVTGIPNRNFFQKNLTELLDSHHQQVGVFMIDLDGFSRINTAVGHKLGDSLLQNIAKYLSTLIPETSVLANACADKFLLAVPGTTDTVQLSLLAERILTGCRQPWKIGEQDFFLTASIGICLFPENGDNAVALMRSADMAVTLAKDCGRNNYQFYVPALTSQALEKLEMEQELHAALDKDEFVLYYQPRIDLSKGEIASFEALIRWNNKKLGLVSPAQFIPLAESAGLIGKIGEWVFLTACKQLQAWNELGIRAVVSVNLSVGQLYQKDFVDLLIKTLGETQVAPAQVELEITESMIMRNIDQAVAILYQIKSLGMTIAMDDFGTGHSSLTNLKRLPIDTLKIDKEFVQDAEHSSESASIVRVIVALGHLLKMRVTAEGVETNKQLALLRRLNCEEVQGYFFSRPVPAEAALELLVNGNTPIAHLKNQLALDSSYL